MASPDRALQQRGRRVRPSERARRRRAGRTARAFAARLFAQPARGLVVGDGLRAGPRGRLGALPRGPRARVSRSVQRRRRLRDHPGATHRAAPGPGLERERRVGHVRLARRSHPDPRELGRSGASGRDHVDDPARRL